MKGSDVAWSSAFRRHHRGDSQRAAHRVELSARRGQRRVLPVHDRLSGSIPSHASVDFAVRAIAYRRLVAATKRAGPGPDPVPAVHRTAPDSGYRGTAVSADARKSARDSSDWLGRALLGGPVAADGRLLHHQLHDCAWRPRVRRETTRRARLPARRSGSHIHPFGACLAGLGTMTA
jgi:hypothetical protein